MWKAKRPPYVTEEEWVRTIKKRDIIGKTYKMEPAALKGIIIKSGGLSYKTIDLDKFLKEKEREGYKVVETEEGITLTRTGSGNIKVFIGADDIHYDMKKARKAKAENDVEEVV